MYEVLSHDYRTTTPYRGSRVAIIGAGFSGIDIGLQVADVAKEVLLFGKQEQQQHGFPANLRQIDEKVVKITTKGVLTIHEEREVDHIIISTGYHCSYPFLPEGLVEVVGAGRVVQPLYQHFVHRHYPTSLFFPGLNFIAALFTAFNSQALYGLSLVEGKADVPSEPEMDAWEGRQLSRLGQRPFRHYHMLANDQWDYYDELQRK
ncbi:unnamed protein product, partial [Mesorhabditis spiculigera]